MELEELKAKALDKLTKLQSVFESIEYELVDLVNRNQFKKSIDDIKIEYVEKISSFDTRCYYDDSLTDDNIDRFIDKTDQGLSHMDPRIVKSIGMFLDVQIGCLEDRELKSLLIDKINIALSQFGCKVCEHVNFCCIKDNLNGKIVYNEDKYLAFQDRVRVRMQGGEGQGM